MESFCDFRDFCVIFSAISALSARGCLCERLSAGDKIHEFFAGLGAVEGAGKI